MTIQYINFEFDITTRKISRLGKILDVFWECDIHVKAFLMEGNRRLDVVDEKYSLATNLDEKLAVRGAVRKIAAQIPEGMKDQVSVGSWENLSYCKDRPVCATFEHKVQQDFLPKIMRDEFLNLFTKLLH